jgi:hypothetical protein
MELTDKRIVGVYRDPLGGRTLELRGDSTFTSSIELEKSSAIVPSSYDGSGHYLAEPPNSRSFVVVRLTFKGGLGAVGIWEDGVIQFNHQSALPPDGATPASPELQFPSAIMVRSDIPSVTLAQAIGVYAPALYGTPRPVLHLAQVARHVELGSAGYRLSEAVDLDNDWLSWPADLSGSWEEQDHVLSFTTARLTSRVGVLVPGVLYREMPISSEDAGPYAFTFQGDGVLLKLSGFLSANDV